MDKVKDMASKATGGGSSSTGGSSGGSSGMDSTVKKGVDTVTDKVGMGDKYDNKISEQANKQVHSQMGKK